MSVTAKDVIAKALSYEGTKASPPGNVIFNTHYYGSPVSGSNYAWCCAYVWDIFRLVGASKLFFNGKKTAYVPAIETYAKSVSQTVKKSAGALGDIVLFDFNRNGTPNHIGFILRKNDDGSYITIEGNTSPSAAGSQANGGCVAIKTRTQSQIRCIYRPKYAVKNPEPAPVYKAGKTYRCLGARSLRSSHSVSSKLQTTLKIGTKVNVKKIKKVKGDIWIYTGSGWCAAYYNGRRYIL